MSEKPEDVFVVLDIETTGLNPDQDSILEIGAICIDLKTLAVKAPTLETIIRYKRNELEPLDPYVEEMHLKNGLLRDCESSTIAQPAALSLLASWMKHHGGSHKNVVLVGNSIHFDRGFITHPSRGSHELTQLLHYRMIDVRSVTYAAESWLEAAKRPGDLKEAEHRALPDACYSLGLLRWLKAEIRLGAER